ncbi:alpha/beta hydrolase [Mycobacterium shimoidei]|uniref:Putative lipase/esterase LipN [Mycobacterium tuberculosis H37Rv] n=1 Tax=Mycobacterium shimoidei TaxID=29313 RepID=A0A1E3TKY1_MYCSH|nr:alpha/beta hydrolase [Mycobacterium shimoidei]MCV7257357.1 alpha/beta hydrolase [Mycobacterium shimoidei]ODR14316.1 lipase [Mycobacterium shimoidei]ORW80393.1 lipase [Mycobacterium shimoidei]SRX95951.1 putative lipase/esterase LipN [Mycobacterium tuberculosis H37Rv] [Mycobacterium shimoidei]
MTRSLPGISNSPLGALRGSSGLTGRLQANAASAAMKVIPYIPSGAKRLLSGGRSITIDGNTLDATLQLTLAGLRVMGLSGLAADNDPATARAQMRQLTEFPGPQIHVAVDDVSIPGPAGDIPARHYRPACPDPAPLLVFYHGGGWVIGDLDTHDQLCRLTCRDADVQVLSIDYRLAPEHPAPAAVDDAYAAFRWACEHAADLGAQPGRVAVGGDSAGGNLAAVVSLLARDEAPQGPKPALQWLIYPRTDFTAQTRSLSLFANGFLLTRDDIDWFESHYLGGSGVDPADTRVSPLLAESLSGLPPALITVAGFDPLRDEGERYAAALRAAGNAVDFRCMGSLTHGFANLFPLGGGCAAATAEMVSALRAHLSRI